MAISTQRRSNIERRQQSVEAVLAGALDLFVHQGYAATSTAHIAARANLTKGAVYHYFKDKEAVLLALLERSESILFQPALAALRADDRDARSRLADFINWVAREGGANKELMLLPVLVSLEFFGFGNQAEQRVRDHYQRLHDGLEQLISEGQAEGAFDTRSPAKTMAVALVAMVDGLLLQWYRFQQDIDGPALARQARTLLLRGLAEG